MKTFSILFCLLAGIAAACAQTSKPVNPNQDKPTRLYVDSYDWGAAGHDHWSTYDFDQNGSQASWFVDDTHAETSESWLDGYGGNGEFLWHEEINDTYGGQSNVMHLTYFWPASSYPDVAEGTVTDVGSGYLGHHVGSPIIWEHCDIGVPVVDQSDSWLNDVDGTMSYYTRQEDEAHHDQAVIKFQTGGKAKPQRQNLIAFNGWANRIVPVRDPFWHNPQLYVQSIPVLAQKITVNGQALGGDGNLYVMMPDNDEEVVTPTVTGMDYYSFGLTYNKYTPVIAARGNGINYDDLSVTNPEFCVGQLLTFWLNWSPPATNADSIFWHLPDKYVNDSSYACSSCSLDYFKNTDLLTNQTTYCWYVRDPGGACSIRETLHFANGQQVNIAAAGNFTIYRPQMTLLDTNFPFTPMVTNGLLQLGPGPSEPGVMRFSATVESQTNFPGNVNWTQLVNRYGEYGPVPLWYTTTHGDYWLDTGRFYNDEGDTRINPNDTIDFNDNPGIQSRLLYANISDRFETYLVFKPDGDGIWVTLGIVNWGWGGDAVYSTSGWKLDDSSMTLPTYTDSDAFPTWSQTYTGSITNN